MDGRLPNLSRQMDTSATVMRTSPPGSASSSPQTMIPPPSNPFAIAPAARAPGLTAPLLQIGPRSPGGYNSSYSQSYPTSSTSPSTASGSLQESQVNDGPALSAGISPTQISSSNLNAQKRAYRQRRKDPSCDACRERKVKCDATETTACSECSSRNHKCQFTKETNRRMSSIKYVKPETDNCIQEKPADRKSRQVQDLQSQLAELRQENSQLRIRVTDKDAMDIDRVPTQHRRLESQTSTQGSPRRIQPPVMHNFDHVRKNIQTHSRGIFDIPFQQRNGRPGDGGLATPDIPPRAEYARLSRSYVDSIHSTFPILHWPTFQDEVDQVYTSRSFHGASQGWIGLFFAVLACGSLQTPQSSPNSPNGQNLGLGYYDIATHALTPSSVDATITHARLAVLLSIFANESGSKKAGSFWLASAVRIAQMAGLHLELQSYGVLEGEMRRRLWWAIYTWDRISSLGENLPMVIQEDDCETPLPSSVEDRYIQSQLFGRPRFNQSINGFVGVIHAVRLFSPVHQALKSSTISVQTLQSFDDKFHSKLTLLTAESDPEGNLEFSALSPLLTLQYARFQLYRRNISPISRPEERLDALHRCLGVAQDTARYITRALRPPQGKPPSDDWRSRVIMLASNMICTHLWRCMLILCFRANYDAALMCVHFSAAVGGIRKVNTAYSKHLAFFLECLMDRVRSGNASLQQLERDEELLAYVSADMQGSPEQSWVWAGSDFASSQAGSQATSRVGNHAPSPNEPMQGTHLPLRPISGSPEQSPKEWDAWGRVEHMIRKLMEEHRNMAFQPSYYPPPHNPVKRVQLTPDAPASPPVSAPLPPPTPSSASRISIANII